jgi:hypothetical protein
VRSTPPRASRQRHPDHANKSGQDEETLQLGHLRVSYGKDSQKGQSEEGQQQGGGQQSSGQQQGQEEDGDDYGYDIWLQAPEKQQQQGAGGGQQQGSQQQGSGSQSEKRNTGGEKARIKFRINNDGGITGRIGNGDSAVRFATHKDGAKIRVGNTWFVASKKDKNALIAADKDVHVDPQGTPFVNKPWKIAQGPKDPIPNDDK